jgi:RNA polymerase sigma factor (sigma-70 family)
MALRTERGKPCPKTAAHLRSGASCPQQALHAVAARRSDLNFQTYGFQIGEKDMNDNARCFILAGDGYEEISYAELQKRRVEDPAYADKRFIPLHGMLMEVTEADYRDFYRNIRRQKYLSEEAARNGAFSYNALDGDEMSGEDIICDTSPPLDEQVLGKLLIEEMLRCLRRLDEADRRLLAALYFEDKSERELARELEIPRKTLSYRKHKILEQLKRLMRI